MSKKTEHSKTTKSNMRFSLPSNLTRNQMWYAAGGVAALGAISYLAISRRQQIKDFAMGLFDRVRTQGSEILERFSEKEDGVGSQSLGDEKVGKNYQHRRSETGIRPDYV